MLDLNKALDIAVETAREAGALLREYYHHGVTVKYKGEIDLITEADRASEALILSRIRSAYPDCAILAEESGASANTSPYVWTVDPLDGTTNFAHGYPVFAVTIALQIDAAIALGVTYDPTRDELFTAQRGHGAFLNDQPIHVSATPVLDRALLITGFPYDRRTNPHNNLREFNALMLKSQAVLRGGSAALDLAYVACGRVDGFWEFRLNAWDIAAGMLLVNEAQGQVTKPAGDQPHIQMRDIVASNGLIHAELLTVLQSLQE